MTSPRDAGGGSRSPADLPTYSATYPDELFSRNGMLNGGWVSVPSRGSSMSKGPEMTGGLAIRSGCVCLGRNLKIWKYPPFVFVLV